MRSIGAWVAAAALWSCGPGLSPLDSGVGGVGTGPNGPVGAHALTIRFGGNGAGNVRSSNPVFDCPSGCVQTIGANASVQLAAVPAAGSAFTGWTGACSGAGVCSLTLDADREVTATFSAVAPPSPGTGRLVVQFAGKGSGRVTSSPAGVDCPSACSLDVAPGTAVTLSAKADASSVFAGFGGACSGAGPCTVTVASGTQTVSVSFDAVPPPVPPSCAGIAAPDDVPRQELARPPAQVACLPGEGDASGTLALPMEFHSPSSHGSLIDFASAGGAFLKEQSSSSEGFRPFGQPVGLAAVGSVGHLYPYNPAQLVSVWDGAGNGAGTTIVRGTFVAAPDPGGGGMLLAGDLNPNSTGPLAHAAMMMAANGAAPSVRWGPKPLASSGAVFGAGVDAQGRSLVITDGGPRFGGGTISAQWFNRDGVALTGEFVLLQGFSAGVATWFETSPLIGGGVVVRRMDQTDTRHAKALVTLSGGSTSPSAVPDWMAKKPDTRLQIARGGRAYAVLPYGALGVACTQRLEIVAPDGASCGTRDYAIAAGTCDTQELKLGMDGTVLQQLPTSMETAEPSAGGHSCTWRWWPAAAH